MKFGGTMIMVLKKIGVFTIFLCFISVWSLAQQRLVPIDAQSQVAFEIKNFGLKTEGRFSGLSGSILFDAQNPLNTDIDLWVLAKTINTNNNSRDSHLRKEEYFDVEKFNRLQFKSTRIAKTTTPGRYQVWGNLTIKGVTKPIQLTVNAIQKSGSWFFTGEFSLNRRHFGVGGNSISLSDKLTVQLTVVAKGAGEN